MNNVIQIRPRQIEKRIRELEAQLWEGEPTDERVKQIDTQIHTLEQEAKRIKANEKRRAKAK